MANNVNGYEVEESRTTDLWCGAEFLYHPTTRRNRRYQSIFCQNVDAVSWSKSMVNNVNGYEVEESRTTGLWCGAEFLYHPTTRRNRISVGLLGRLHCLPMLAARRDCHQCQAVYLPAFCYHQNQTNPQAGEAPCRP